MFKLYRLEEKSKGHIAYILVATGPRGTLGPLMNQLSRGKEAHAIYDVNGTLVSRSY